MVGSVEMCMGASLLSKSGRRVSSVLDFERSFVLEGAFVVEKYTQLIIELKINAYALMWTIYIHG